MSGEQKIMEKPLTQQMSEEQQIMEMPLPQQIVNTIADCIPIINTLVINALSQFCETNLDALTGFKNTKTKQHLSAEDIVLELKFTINHVNQFTEQVKKLLSCCNSENLTEIVRNVGLKNWQPLKDFLYHVKREIDMNEARYKEFVSKYDEVQSKLTAAIQESDEAKNNSESNRVTTHAVGGTAAAGLAGAATGGVMLTVAGVGVGISIGLGALTLGIGLPIGLAVTGVAVAATGGAAAIATTGITIHMSKEYKKLIEIYKQLHEGLHVIKKTSQSLREQVESIKDTTQYMERAVDEIDHYYQTKRLEKQLCDALIRLSQMYTEFYPLICKNIQEYIDKLNAALTCLD